MKSYTDIEQSKKLAEILSLESADMFYNEEPDETYPKDILDTKYPMVIRKGQKHYLDEYGIPCWSLAALMNVLPSATLDSSDDHHYRVHCKEMFTDWYDNAIDACVELILKLKEKGLL